MEHQYESLRRKDDIAALFASTNRVRYDGLRLIWRSNHLQWNRLLVAVSFAGAKKSAVLRNRLKRVGREIYRQRNGISIRRGIDIALIVRPDFDRNPHVKRMIIFDRLLREGGLDGG